MFFRNRADAGKRLAEKLMQYADRSDTLVLALPRGGVPVAYYIAKALHAPLDVLIVRKLGVPGHGELAMGAVASPGHYVVDARLVSQLGITPQEFNRVLRRERDEIVRRTREYRDGWPAPDAEGRIVIVVDDGLATGSTMTVAVQALRSTNCEKIIVAVPVASPEGWAMVEREADEVVALDTPEDFRAVGNFYEDFTQTTDAEVRRYLAEWHPVKLAG